MYGTNSTGENCSRRSLRAANIQHGTQCIVECIHSRVRLAFAQGAYEYAQESISRSINQSWTTQKSCARAQSRESVNAARVLYLDLRRESTLSSIGMAS